MAGKVNPKLIKTFGFGAKFYHSLRPKGVFKCFHGRRSQVQKSKTNVALRISVDFSLLDFVVVVEVKYFKIHKCKFQNPTSSLQGRPLFQSSCASTPREEKDDGHKEQKVRDVDPIAFAHSRKLSTASR
jgi:hypothetical protein